MIKYDKYTSTPKPCTNLINCFLPYTLGYKHKYLDIIVIAKQGVKEYDKV